MAPRGHEQRFPAPVDPFLCCSGRAGPAQPQGGGKLSRAAFRKKTVGELADIVAQKDSNAACHAALRLAVNDTNTFDFDGAVHRLDRWNPILGGNLPQAAEWAGKVISTLGQSEAFLGRPERGLEYFKIALQQFDKLSALDPQLAERQRSQTAVYAAIAAMDMPGCSCSEAALEVCKALGCDCI